MRRAFLKGKKGLESLAGPPGKAWNYQTRMSKTQTTNINNKKINISKII